MTQQIKIGAYAVLLCLGVWFGYGFFKNLSAATASEASPVEATNQVSEISSNQQESATVTNQVTNSVSNTKSVAPPPKPQTTAPGVTPVVTRGKNTSAVMSYGAGLFV